MNEKVEYILQGAVKIAYICSKIKSGEYSDKGVQDKLDEIEYLLSELDCILGEISRK